jgi:uncharacterized membrane protein YraQ (UPF0718 family)
MKKKKNKKYNYFFLLLTIVAYLSVLFIYPNKSNILNKNIFNLMGKILPVLILIFIFMFLLELFFPVKKMAELFKKQKSFVLWGVAIISGILSSGSIYLWYPILKELKDNGVKGEILAVFIFNRAVKLQLLPMMILYFGLKYVIVLTVVMILISILYGFIFKLLYLSRS